MYYIFPYFLLSLLYGIFPLFLTSLTYKNSNNNLVSFIMIVSYIFMVFPFFLRQQFWIISRSEVLFYNFNFNIATKGLLIETVYTNLCFLSIYIFDRVIKERKNYKYNLNFSIKDIQVIFIITFFVYFSLDRSLLLKGYESATLRLSSENFADFSVNSSVASILRNVNFIFSSILLIDKSSRPKSKHLNILIRALAALYILYVYFWAFFISGGRGYIISFSVGFLSIYFIMKNIKEKRKYKFILRRIFLIIIIILLFLFFVSDSYRVYRSKMSFFSNISVSQRIPIFFSYMLNTRNNHNKEEGLNQQFLDLFMRYDSIVNGGALVEYVNEIGHSYFKTFKGVFLSFIPRTILKSKPIPLSYNNSYYGIPQYIVAKLRGAPEINMGVSSGAVSYWHFGIIGLLIEPVLFGLFLLVIIKKITNNRLLLALIIGILAIDSYGTFFIPLDKLLLIIIQKIFILILFMFVFNFIKKNIFKRGG